MLKKIFLISIVLLIPLSSIFALQIDWPPSPMGTDLSDASKLTDLTRYFYEWGIALGGLAAFIALLIAGFMYLTSVGDPQKMADARGRIVWALAGLVLLLASWLILNTINPDLTTLLPPEIKPPEKSLNPYGKCENNDDCPLRYECNDENICLPPKNLSIKPCTEVELTGGVAKIIPVDSNTQITLPANTVFSAEGQPENCAGYLDFYSDNDCKENKETITPTLANHSFSKAKSCVKLTTSY